MTIPITSADFTQILTDLQVTVSYYAVTNVIDPVYGSNAPTYASPVSKSWIFYKRSGDLKTQLPGLVDNGDAYVFMPTTDSMNFGDRIVYGGETFEFSHDCIYINRYAGTNNLFKYYTVKKVD
jgi:hypothetical protein